MRVTIRVRVTVRVRVRAAVSDRASIEAQDNVKARVSANVTTGDHGRGENDRERDPLSGSR